MATINSISKAIESSVKSIATLEKKVAMYSDRTTKALAKFGKKYNMELTTDNFEDLLADNMHFGDRFTIKSNIYHKDENEKKLARENARLATLKAELASMQSAQEKKEKEREGLLILFSEKLATAKEMWLERMEEWANAHYDYILANKDEAKAIVKRFDELQTIKTRIYNGWSNRNKTKEEKDAMWEEYREENSNLISKGIARNRQIATDKAQFYATKELYVADVIKLCKDLWEADLVKLADDCKHYKVDETKVKCSDVNPTEKGFEVIVTDGKPRTIHARIIWCAEDSVLVKPHSRYIITERKK